MPPIDIIALTEKSKHDGSGRAAPRLWSPINARVEVSSPEKETQAALSVPTPPTSRRKESGRDKTSPKTAEKQRYRLAIKELPSEERPRERLWKYGPQALTTGELIALIIRAGTDEHSAVALGEHLIAHFGNIKGIACASLDQLSQVKGIGKAKAAEIQAAIEFGHRLSLFSDEGRHSINSPADAAQLLLPELRYLKKETLKSILLDTKNRVIAVKTVSIGDLTSSIVHPREVFKEAVVASAAAILVAHNHPSGDPTPSSEDVAVTKRLIAAGEIMGIDLLDHLVIGDGVWVSLKERGLI